MKFSRLLLSGVLSLAVAGVQGNEPEAVPTKLTIDRIYVGDEFDAESCGARWLPSGDAYTVLESAEGGKEVVRYEAATGERTVLVSAALLTPAGESRPLPIDDYSWSKDQSRLLIYTNSQRVWRLNTRGDYWVLDLGSRQLFQLGGDAPPASLMFAKFAPDGRSVAFVRDGDLYVQAVGDDGVRRLTQSEDEFVVNGTFDWVYEEEFGLRDGFRWSPDSSRIAYWQIDSTAVPKFPLMNNTDSLYPQVDWIPYPKVGETNPIARIGVLDLATGETNWLQFPGDASSYYLPNLEWHDDGRLVVEQLNRAQNEESLWLIDAQSGELSVLVHETDDAWIDMHDDLVWFDEGKRFAWASERDGWRHIYLGDTEGRGLQLATPGNFDVIDLLRVDDLNEELWFIASPNDATERFLYRCRFNGQGLERVTPEGEQGVHAYNISPNGRWAIHTASRMNQPPVTSLISLPDHETIRVLCDNEKLRERLKELEPTPVEFFQVEIDDGVLLDGWLISPPNYDPAKKYPLIVYVYGEPAGSTVVDRWGGDSYLWNAMLAQQGYFLMSIDNRGTKAPRGRAWRKSVRHKIGVLPPQDQAAALEQVLARRPYLDGDRVGVWGWSGGGSMSLNAIFKYPDLYQAAIAIAAVPNQRYYDTIYQERYMGLPGENPEGFRQGSPINFAEGLVGDLLIVHGTGDDNCHYATTEMLIDELIRCNKQFELMVYPNRTHSIRERKNTTRHLRTLMADFFLENTPPGAE